MPHKLSDKEILTLLLNQQKHLAEEYNHTASHTDDPNLLHTLTDIIASEQKTRLQIYQAMHQRGWYNPQAIDRNQVDQARHQFQQTRQKLQNLVANATQHAGQNSFGWSGGAQQSPTGFQQTFSSQTPAGPSHQPAFTGQPAFSGQPSR